MAQRTTQDKEPGPVATWIRQNVIEAAPLWIQLLRDALDNVRSD